MVIHERDADEGGKTNNKYSVTALPRMTMSDEVEKTGFARAAPKKKKTADPPIAF